MPGDPARPRAGTDRLAAVDAEIVEKLAAIDDRLAGHSPAAQAGPIPDLPGVGEAGVDMSGLAAALDTMLLLRQAAAAEGLGGGDRLALPQRIGRYVVVREAGRGAFAYVLEAYDALLHRRVALKVARPEALVSALFRRRFIREAELAARLVHPHIVTVYEVGEAEGLVHIVSEYCEGGDLAAWLDRHPGPLPPRQAAELIRSLAGAVGHAHAVGVIHRDIKPANVLLVPPANLPAGTAAESTEIPLGQMTAKLGDFGLGKFVHGQIEEEFTRISRSGARMGTPVWMAPEQIDHACGEVGPATDIHGLGLLLDRLLTGRSQFGGANEAEIFRAVLLDEPVSPDRVEPGVPRDLAAVCLRCLAKRPQDRYASALDLAAELSRYLAGMPTRARPLSAPARLVQMLIRRPFVPLLGTAVLACLSLAFWAVGERRQQMQRLVQSQSTIGRLEAASELRRGFEAWRTGNAQEAIGHLMASGKMDADLPASLAARWLMARLHGEQDMLIAPDDPPGPRPDIYCFSWAPDGQTMAAGGADGRVTIVRLDATGAAIGPPRVIAAHDEVNDVSVSPDGQWVASAGEDGRLRIWSAADGSLHRDVYQAAGPLFAVAWSPTGTLLACGGAHQRLAVVNLAAEETLVEEMSPFAAAVAAQQVAPDADVEALQFLSGDQVAVACGRLVALVDLEGGVVRSFVGHEGTVGQIAISAAGDRLLAAGTDRVPRVWEIATGRLLLALPRHPNWVQGCGFSPDGSSIVTGCRDGVVRIFATATGEQQRKFVGHLGRTWDVKYSPSGMVVSAGADGTLRRWAVTGAEDASGMRDVQSPLAIDVEDVSGSHRCAVCILESPAERRTAILQVQAHTLLVDIRSGRVSGTPASSPTAAYSIAVDNARCRVAVAPTLGPIGIYPVSVEGAADPLVHMPPMASTPIASRSLAGMAGLTAKSVTWTPAGMLVAGCDHGRLLAWDVTLDEVTEVERLERTVDVVRVAPAGPARLAAGAGKVIRIYPLPAAGPPSARGARTLLTLAPEAGLVVKIAWSPDGTRLAYGTTLGQMAVIDAASGALVKTFAKHGREVTGMVWPMDGRTLVTADAECVRFTDATTAITWDELRPGWNIEDVACAGAGGAGGEPLLVLAGSAPATSFPGAPAEQAREEMPSDAGGDQQKHPRQWQRLVERKQQPSDGAGAWVELRVGILDLDRPVPAGRSKAPARAVSGEPADRQSPWRLLPPARAAGSRSAVLEGASPAVPR